MQAHVSTVVLGLVFISQITEAKYQWNGHEWEWTEQTRNARVAVVRFDTRAKDLLLFSKIWPLSFF